MSECKWEVGRTYKTTLPGVTGSIRRVDSVGDFIGEVNGSHCDMTTYWHRDGRDYNENRRANLTTELADEPQVEPAKPQSVEYVSEKPKLRATIDTRNGRWVVVDSLRPGMFASFGSDRDTAETACEIINRGDNCFKLHLSSDEPQQVDVVNAPPHYNQGDIECIDAIQAALSPEEFRGHLRACALKYLWRCNHKGGREDLLKAEWYLKRLNREMIRGECASHGGKGCEKEGGEACES